MVAVVEEHSGQIAELCRRLGVRRLDVFGSPTGDRFDPERSDVDFLVEFDIADPVAHARAYFALSAGLKNLLSRDVDLVEVRAVSNPYFLESINRDRRQIYAA
ncbi:MAG: nucleotidyltransferase domain-containing protein [Phycisphaerales bacterium]